MGVKRSIADVKNEKRVEEGVVKPEIRTRMEMKEKMGRYGKIIYENC